MAWLPNNNLFSEVSLFTDFLSPALSNIRHAIRSFTNRCVVNVKNSFVVSFLDRQTAFVKKWPQHRDVDNLYQSDIICEINGWPT